MLKVKHVNSYTDYKIMANKFKKKIQKGHAVNQPKKKMTDRHKAAGKNWMAKHIKKKK